MAWRRCHVLCDFSLLIVLNHRRLHTYLVTEESITIPTYFTCLPFYLIFGKILYDSTAISILTLYNANNNNKKNNKNYSIDNNSNWKRTFSRKKKELEIKTISFNWGHLCTKFSVDSVSISAFKWLKRQKSDKENDEKKRKRKIETIATGHLQVNPFPPFPPLLTPTTRKPSPTIQWRHYWAILDTSPRNHRRECRKLVFKKCHCTLVLR